MNRIDAAAMKHDIFYRDHDDLTERHKADRIMIQELDAIEKPTLRERFERAIVKKALQAKVKLLVQFKIVAYFGNTVFHSV